jgi:hypothetical protein
MKTYTEDNSFLSQWKYVELARYIDSIKRVIREKDSDGVFLYDIRRAAPYSTKYNNTGIYTSIWRYNSVDLEKATRFGPLYFDIDNQDINISYDETKKLYDHLCLYVPKDSVYIFFTGKKGFHIECDPVCLGINPSNDLPSIFRFIASSLLEKLKLSSVDFSVYDPRRMWRLEGTKHQSTGLYKTLIDEGTFNSGIDQVTEYASSPRNNDIQFKPFDYKANEWYRNYVYLFEESKNKPVDVLSHFNQYGSSGQKTFNTSEKVFQKDKLLNNCSAVKRLEDQAKRTNFLEHEARLFLCSILTYSEEGIEYLHEILSHCSDYNLHKSSAHINDWIKRREMGIGGRPYTCERANAAGVGCGECSLESKSKWVKINGKFMESGEKSSPSPVRFAYSNKREVNEDEK